MRKIIILVILVESAFAVKNLAVLEIIPNKSVEEEISILESRHLTDELRRQAVTVLPIRDYTVLTRDNIIALIPPDGEESECLVESCAVDIGRAIGVDYVTHGMIGKFGKKYTLSIELYETMGGKLLGSIVAESNDIDGLLTTIRQEANPLFSRINAVVAPLPAAAVPVASGIGAVKEQGFGILSIKPAYLGNITRNKSWNLTINGETALSWENKLPPGKHNIKLSHECYEDVSFNAEIEKNVRKIFDMSNKIALKKGDLILETRINGSPSKEPVFIDDKQVGVTPFKDFIPLCSDIKVGKNKKKADIQLEHNKTVEYTLKTNDKSSTGTVSETAITVTLAILVSIVLLVVLL
jgi:hypothetical protein